MAVPSDDVAERAVNPPVVAEAEDSAPQTLNVANRDATELESYHSAATNASKSSQSQYQGHFGPLKNSWRRQVSLTVPHVKCRDHLGMLTIPRLVFHYLDGLQLNTELQQMSVHS